MEQQIKPLREMSEAELREYINYRHKQWSSAEKRVDLYGSFKSISQANNYRIKYITALKIAREQGFTLSEKEYEISLFKV